MSIAKILEKLGVTQLDESVQTEVKMVIEEMIELKAKERAEELSGPIMEEKSKALIEEMDAKFEDYKQDVMSRWSDFLDDTIEEEMKLPDNIVEYAKLGELYKPIMEMCRTRLAVNEGSVNEEANSLLGEAREEIISLREKLNESIKESAVLKQDAKSMAVQVYLRKKCDGLTEAQKSTVLKMIGDLTDKKQIDEKFKFISEHMFDLSEGKKSMKEDNEFDEVADDDADDNKGDKKSKKKKGKDCDCDDDADDKGKKKKDKDSIVEEGTSVMSQYLAEYQKVRRV